MKRVDGLRQLSDDHHTGLVLARRCKQAGSKDSELSPEQVWAQVLDAFSSHLEPHFQLEEQHLLPALEAIGEAPLASRIREDHRQLRAMRTTGAASRALLERFGQLLESHIRYEERRVFEPTQNRLPARALEAIASAYPTAPQSRPAPPEV